VTTRRWTLVTLGVMLAIYAGFCVRGWLGIEEVDRRNQDDTYFAAVYSHSKLFAPFMKTRDVLIPSASDLNSHTVFETYGFRKTIDIRWGDSGNLQVICRHCSQSSLLTNKVDNIRITLIRQ
jgi:hypothetical protein